MIQTNFKPFVYNQRADKSGMIHSGKQKYIVTERVVMTAQPPRGDVHERLNTQFSFFIVRRYTSAEYAMVLCTCLSATSRSTIKTAERIELVFGVGASLHVLEGNSGTSKR